jgi:hypothetical protein
MRCQTLIIGLIAYIIARAWPNEHRPRSYRGRRFRTRHTPTRYAADFILLRLTIQRRVATGWLGYTPSYVEATSC